MTRAVAGMRGGLGRILLTAFMLLAIVPLSVVSFLAVRRVQADARRSTEEDLAWVAASAASQLDSWLGMQAHVVSLLSRDPTLVRAVREERWTAACTELWSVESGLPAFALEDTSTGRVDCTVMDERASTLGPPPVPVAVVSAPVLDAEQRRLCTLVVPFGARELAEAVAPVVSDPDLGVFLRDGNAVWWSLAPSQEDRAEAPASPPEAELGDEGGSGRFEVAPGEFVVSAYRHLHGHSLALWVQQPEEAIAAREDDLAAMLIGSTLAVALLTAVSAAFVTRQLTQPLVRLTMTAVRIASGDLDQTVEVTRRDEIGVLGHAFNVMSTELRSLYDGLEQKVAERTEQLTEANEELRYKAMQLKLSAEVGRVATSILDLELLLDRVTRLILDTYAHVYAVRYVAIWRQDEVGERVERLSSRGRDADSDVRYALAGDGNLIGQAIADGALRVRAMDDTTTQIVVPLRIGTQVIGGLELHCARGEAIGADDMEALQSLGDQISVAIENARLYAVERQAVERLSRLDDLRLASLGIGSRELATELNTIIGFSRLMLKGADGPLTDLQRADAAAIYKSGYKLLGLIDNVITLAELESGAQAVAREPVDLEVLLEEAVTAARQRAVDVVGGMVVHAPLTHVLGDARLLRQALVSLIGACADQTQQPCVPIEVGPGERDGACLLIRIGCTAATDEQVSSGRPPEYEAEEMEVGIALARRIIALHDGELHMVFDASAGLSSMIVLPVYSGEVAGRAPLDAR
ncbi:MAG: HAMP domain-containing protein [Anaerolineae bacterium]|nr:HAMP domain-containing protein [Anaerolineae bacterium]